MREMFRLMVATLASLFLSTPALVFCTDSPTHVNLPPLEGMIEASEIIEIGCQSPGIAKKILVERGDVVKKGELLVRLEDSVERSEVALKKVRLEFAERKLKRSKELSVQQLISQHELDELETDVMLSRLELQEARAMLSLKSITSPVSGVVKERNISPGEYIGPDVIVMTIAQVDPLYIEVVAPVRLFGSIKKGMRAKVHPEAPLHDRTYHAEVIIVDQVIDGASGTFGVRLLLPNPEMKLPAGLKCQVQFLP